MHWSDKRIWWLAVGIMAATVLVTRFYNLRTSARFIWDESSDLVRMRELYLHPKLTLLGPMSEDGVKIFGSLTYYLSLPFAIAANFKPEGPVWATAFFGVMTVILGVVVARKLKLPVVATVILLSVSIPLLEAARWAWNPHFIPFWETLAIICFVGGGFGGMFLAGLFMGLTIHHHYYGLFVLTGMAGMVLWEKEKRLKKLAAYLGGAGAAIFPFGLFDITHPPGLFISRMIYFSPVSTGQGAFQLSSIIQKAANLPLQFFNYLSGGNYWSGIIVFALFLGTLIRGIKKNHNKWLIPVFTQIGGLTLIGGEVYNHYLLPAVMFFYIWLIFSFKKSGAAKALAICLVVVNLWGLKPLMVKNDWSTNMAATEKITEIIEDEYRNKPAKFNMAVLGSPDPNTKGRRYRDLLSIRNVQVEPVGDYQKGERMYLVSYLPWDKLKEEPSYELDGVREKEPIKEWRIENSEWKLYLLER